MIRRNRKLIRRDRLGRITAQRINRAEIVDGACRQQRIAIGPCHFERGTESLGGRVEHSQRKCRRPLHVHDASLPRAITRAGKHGCRRVQPARCGAWITGAKARLCQQYRTRADSLSRQLLTLQLRTHVAPRACTCGGARGQEGEIGDGARHHS